MKSFSFLVFFLFLIILLLPIINAGSQYPSSNTYGARYVWQFNEESFGNAVDDIAGINLIETGTVVVTTGKYGNAANYSSGTNYHANNTIDFDSGFWTKMSVCAWINPTLNGEEEFITIGYDASNRFHIMPNGAAKDWRAYFKAFNIPCDTDAGVGKPVNLSKWQHICVTLDNINFNMYVNGYLDQSVTCLYGFDDWASQATIWVGDSGALSRGTNPSAFDELLIFNKTLTAAEILNIYSGSVPGGSTASAGISINNTYPTNSSLLASNNFTFIYNLSSINLTNITRCQLLTNHTGGLTLNVTATNTTAIINGENYFNNTYISNDAKYLWRVACNFTNGTTYFSDTFYHKVDNSTPTITFNRPNANSQIPANNWSMNISGYDIFLDLMNLTFYNSTGSITYTNTTSTITTSYYSYNFSAVFAYDNNYMIEACVRDSATYSPDKPLYTATQDGFGIRFIDIETNNDITMSIEIIDKVTKNPISITGSRGAKVNISYDGKHIKYGGTIKINNLNEVFRLTYQSNNPTKRFIPKSYLPAQFITSDYGLYFHHKDLVDNGFTIIKNYLNQTTGKYVVEFTNNFIGMVIFDPITGGLHSLCENKTLYVDFQNPTAIYNNKSPNDLTLTGFIGASGINITYNFSDYNLDYTTATMFYKSNNSYNDYMFYQNGTAVSGYFSTNVDRTNQSNIYTFNLKDNQILPGTYNYGEVTLENTPHNYTNLTQNNEFVSIEFLNVSNKTQYGFLEIMALRQYGTGNLRLYYCNSSYSFTGQPAVVDSNCYNFFSINASAYDHIHTAYSSHIVAPFPVNITTGKSGGVAVTSTSYFIIRGATGSIFSYSSIPYSVGRTNVFKISTNNGVSWIDNSSTMVIDAHLHQFEPNSSLWVYGCVNDTFNHSNCTTPRQDLFGLGGLPPSAPNVYEPTYDHGNYTGNIYTNWTDSLSPNGSAINYYNVSLYLANDTKVIELRGNNSLNLSYLFNISNYSDGEYYTYVQAYDTIGFTSYGTSQNFTVDQCVWYIANTSWGNWANTSCVGSYMNYTRNYTLYENVSCNEFVNETYNEGNLTNIWEYTTYGTLVNESCVGDQRNVSQNRTEYDALRCGDNTTLVNSTLYDAIYKNTSWSSWYNITECQFNDTVQQERNLTMYDEYICAANQTFYEYRDQSCNYAAPSINIIYPAIGVTYTNITDSLNYSVYDYNNTLTCWYSINNGTNSSVMSPCANVTNITTIYGWNISAFSGANTWTVYAQDVWGLVGSVTWTFYVNFGAVGTGTTTCKIYRFGLDRNDILYTGDCPQCRYKRFGYYDITLPYFKEDNCI
jgi:hypothetical protein